MRKILVSLLVVAMMLGLVGTAFAGFSDTTKDANVAYIDKAAAFNWLKGYPDGSFKPAGNITRAEFCAVVVRALGLESAASSTSGLSSKFPDVKGTDWFAGYVNVAVNKGVIKGYPDGTFKPNANVSNAEAITMVVRALNREADAIGEWPVGHITVAASQSIIGSGFVSNALATRGDVARYIAKAADVPWKELTTNGWVESTSVPAASFIKANTIRKYTGNVNDTDPTNKSITVNVTTAPTASDLGMKTYTLDDSYRIAGGVGLLDIKGYTVDVFRNNDTGKVLFIEPTTTVTKKSGDIRGFQWEGLPVTSGNTTYLYFYLYDDTTKYTAIYAGTGAGSFIRNGSTMVAPASTTVNTMAVDDNVSFFIGNDGNVSYINSRGYNYTRYIVTDMYTAGTPNSITIKRADISSAITLNVNADTKIELNGVEGKFTDLAKDNVVSIAYDANSTSTATIISATNKSVTGKITAKRRTDSDDGITRYYISIDGVEYRWESTSEVKDNATYNSATKIFGETSGLAAAIKVGQQVTIYLSQRGRIKYIDITSGVADQGKIKRFVSNSNASYDTWVMDMKGTETTYEIAKNPTSGVGLHSVLVEKYKQAAGSVVGGFVQIGRTLRAGDYVALNIDTDGRISDVTLLADAEAQWVAGNGGGAMAPWTNATPTYPVFKLGDVYSGDKIVTINSMAYLVTNDTLLYVNGNPGSMGSVSKDAYAAVSFDTTANSVKLKALIVDGFAVMDTAAMVPTATTLKGFDKATEPWSLVQVFNGSTFLGQDYSDDNGGALYPFNTGRSGTGYNGGFSITFASQTAGTMLTVRVVDRFGNVTTGQVKVP